MKKMNPRIFEPAAITGCYTAAEAANILRVSVPLLYRMMNAGTAPPSFTVGKRRLFPRAALEAWLQTQVAAANASQGKAAAGA